MIWIRIWMCDSYHDWNSNWSNILAPDMLTDLVIWSWWVCDPQWQLCIAFWYPDYVTNLFLMILWCTMTAKYCILISQLCDQSTAFWYPNYLTNVLHSDVLTIWSKYRILISRLCDQSTAFWYPDYLSKLFLISLWPTTTLMYYPSVSSDVPPYPWRPFYAATPKSEGPISVISL
jgi:hypothetical protein